MTSLPLPVDVLPHRPPFLFVDELVALEPGVSAVGTWRLTGDEWFFPGHFPGRPTLPGVLMCEAIAQVGAIAVLTDPRFAGKLPLFGGLDSARFRRQVEPGDKLELHVELVTDVGPGRQGSWLGAAARGDGVRVRVDVRARRPLRSGRGEPERRGDQGAVLARRAALDELGGGDQAVAEGDLFDDIGIVARAAEPLIDDIDEADVVAAVEPGVHQIGPVDVEDHES